MRFKFDLVTIIIAVSALIVLSIGALLIGNFGGSFGSDLADTASDMDISSTNAGYATDFIENDSAKFGDNYFFWFLVATFIGIILTGLYLEFEPVTMILIFLFGCIAVAGAWMGSNMHSEFAQDTDLSSTDMPKTNALMSTPYFPIFIFVCLLILVIIMYTRKRGVDV